MSLFEYLDGNIIDMIYRLIHDDGVRALITEYKGNAVCTSENVGYTLKYGFRFNFRSTLDCTMYDDVCNYKYRSRKYDPCDLSANYWYTYYKYKYLY